MAKKQADWRPEYDEAGNMVIVAGADRINLGPRDEAVVRLADFLGDDLLGVAGQAE